MTLIARLKLTLSDVEPQVLRRFDVPLKIKLNRLHDVIQAAMGWSDSHLYEFKANGVGWGVPDPDGFYDGPLPANKASLFDVLEDVGTKTIHYIYDFGDNWHHVIKVEKSMMPCRAPHIRALSKPSEPVRRKMWEAFLATLTSWKQWLTLHTKPMLTCCSGTGEDLTPKRPTSGIY